MESLVVSKKQLGIELSRIKPFMSPKVREEQYSTHPNIAAEVLWSAYMGGKVRDKTCSDLGCGTGIIGIGLLLLGASKVYFVDKDQEVLEEAEENYNRLKQRVLEGNGEIGECIFFNGIVSQFKCPEGEKINLVVQNPPFGTKQKHADKSFLEVAFSLSNNVYSFHKESTLKFLEAISKDEGFKICQKFFYEFPLKKTMKHHEKKVKKIEVVVCEFERI